MMHTGASMDRGRLGHYMAWLTGLFTVMAAARAALPHIDLIERFRADEVLIHFETEAHRAYKLEYTSAFIVTSNGIFAVWTELYSVPNYPFTGHYVVVDTRLAPARFYRLVATP